MNHLGSLAVACGLVLLAFASHPAKAAGQRDDPPRTEWTPCSFDETELAFDRYRGDPARLRCGHIVVPEDRSRAGSRSLRLAFVIVKAERPTAGSAPVVYLEGGPGVAPLGAYFLGFEGPALATDRDVITFDQRGTGRSEPFCPSLFDDEREIARRDLTPAEASGQRARARQACIDEMRRLGIDPASYDMAATVADVEDLRRALGIERWTLLGRSYGGALAQRIMRHHAERVHSVVLINSAPLDWSIFEQDVPNFARGLRRVFDECAAQAACRGAFPDPESELLRAHASLEREPWTVDVDPSVFGATTFTINGPELIEIMYDLLYADWNIPYLPRIVRGLARRDSALAAALVSRVFGGARQSYAVQYSVWCRDAVTAGFRDRFMEAAAPHPTPLQVIGLPLEVCGDWPVTPVAPAERLPVESAIPTLILSGGHDHNVPTASGTAMLRGLPNGRQIIFPHSSHILPSAANVDCVVVILRAFLTDPRGPLDTSCVEAVPAPSYSTELPEWVTEIGRESTENGSAQHFQDAVRPLAAVGEAR